MINLKNLSFGYRTKQLLFSDMDLSLQKGHIYGLLGKNGVGKSTLLKLFSGLLFPTSGNIEVMGATPRLRKPSFLSDLFFIPEEIYLPEMNMKKYAKLMQPFYPRFNPEQLISLMDEFEISMETRFNNLSFGQKKKALIALALSCNTSLLMMDEPTNGLDIPSKSIFRKVISSFATEERCIIISTHQVRDLENLIDALVIVNDNRILLNVTTDIISDKLSFKAIEKGDEVLYEESSLKGNWGVTPNTDNISGAIDMEMFFNAVLKNPVRIEQILKD